MKVRRGAIADQVVLDGESVVLVGHTLLRLSPLPTAILEHTNTWVETADLVGSVTAALSSPPDNIDPVVVIERVIAELLDEGVLEHD